LDPRSERPPGEGASVVEDGAVSQSAVPGEPTDERAPGDVERIVAVWSPGMSRANYLRLLRWLFDPRPGDDEPPDEDDDNDPERAA
jgi:hypothetical protein